MIIEREVWQAKFGQGDQIAEAFQTWRNRFDERFGLKTRVMADVTGPMFTVVAETEYRDMTHIAEMDAQLGTLFADPEFQEWFSSWQGAAESGRRELYRVLD